MPVIELSEDPQDITASWHLTPATMYGEPLDAFVTAYVNASGIDVSVRAFDAIAGLGEIAAHLEDVAARVRELVRHLERDATSSYQRTATELESDIHGRARKFSAAECAAARERFASSPEPAFPADDDSVAEALSAIAIGVLAADADTIRAFVESRQPIIIPVGAGDSHRDLYIPDDLFGDLGE